jgi:hypothetical protein
MNSLVPREHRDKFPDLSGSRVRLLHGLNAEQHGVTIGSVQRGNELQSPRVRLQRGLKSGGTFAPLGES